MGDSSARKLSDYQHLKTTPKVLSELDNLYSEVTEKYVHFNSYGKGRILHVIYIIKIIKIMKELLCTQLSNEPLVNTVTYLHVTENVWYLLSAERLLASQFGLRSVELVVKEGFTIKRKDVAVLF
jgi:hypothetical protein